MTTSVKIALVTGGGSGIGAAICRRLARDGISVGVLDIDKDAAGKVSQEITRAGGKAMALAANVADRNQVRTAVAQLRNLFGSIGVLVNNAGVEHIAQFSDVREEAWDRVLSINLKGIYITTQEVLSDMVAAGWGRIVNISALGAQMGAPNMLPYSASKGGVIAVTRSLATELGKHGITVNSISPGVIDTPMVRRATNLDGTPVPFDQIVATFPVARAGRPEDVAAACAFFVSAEAGYITSQILGVNGGAG